MNRIFSIILVTLATVSLQASNNNLSSPLWGEVERGLSLLGEPAGASSILDKTAAIVGRKGGVQANFKISSGKAGSTSGTIAIKGRKFYASTPQAKVWYDGKTQWSYMLNTDEVNITTPDAAQQAQMNPLNFINMYKAGYSMTKKVVGTNYEIYMQATNKKNPVTEMVVVVNQKSYIPSQVRMKQKGQWTTISISNFKATNQSDATFVFNKKNYPDAEIVDLR